MGSRSMLQGTPWHEEQIKRTCKSGSKYCIYNRNICVCTHSKFYHKKCVGKGECEDFESKGGTPKVYSEKTIIFNHKNNNPIEKQNNINSIPHYIKKENLMNDINNVPTEETITNEAQETSEEKFKRISKKRIDNVVEDLRLLSSMADRAYYSYSDEQIQKMFNHIDKAVQKMKDAYYNKDFLEEFSWDE